MAADLRTPAAAQASAEALTRRRRALEQEIAEMERWVEETKRREADARVRASEGSGVP